MTKTDPIAASDAGTGRRRGRLPSPLRTARKHRIPSRLFLLRMGGDCGRDRPHYPPANLVEREVAGGSYFHNGSSLPARRGELL